MGKIADKYIKVDDWSIIEEGFDPNRNEVSESLFSLGNEYAGIRGYMEEGVTAPSLQGAYFNGVYEWEKPIGAEYKGMVTRTHYMTNADDFISADVFIDGVKLDIAKANIKNFERRLDFKTGVYTRSFTLVTERGSVDIRFTRMLDMVCVENAFQRIEVTADYDADICVYVGIRFDTSRGGICKWRALDKRGGNDECAIIGVTGTTNQYVASKQYVKHVGVAEYVESEYACGHRITAKRFLDIVKSVVNLVDKTGEVGEDLMKKFPAVAPDFEDALISNAEYWVNFWKKSDIQIDGNDEDQQGIRFCMFQLQQTYHGASATDNIGAKGLTGEVYAGHAFWDTETYCLPYYLFNNMQAAKSLLLYRYNGLDKARARAKELDCAGAVFPLATLNGGESCSLWQHANLQMQPTTAVAYGIYHYVNVSGDSEFLQKYGLEMLVEISRYLVTRGDFDSNGGYGYYAVMGPDEFQMMVNQNCYTNYMAKKTLLYTLDVIEQYKHTDEYKKLNVTAAELARFRKCAENMIILYDEQTMLFEQHDGFYKLPHVDIHSIPVEQFPLYRHWTYDRIFRNDMIKQPDVLMFMLLYNGDFSVEQIRANYEYYEPRTIHESSLSPSVHSILAAQIGKEKDALDFFGFACRLDLDNYNRNTREGLHTTSLAAAWLNIVYGFGGVRSDGEKLVISPTIPKIWKSYSFRINYRGSEIAVKTEPHKVTVTVSGAPVTAVVCGMECVINDVCEIAI